MKIYGCLSKFDRKNTDPFLLLDEGTIRPPGGFGDHPHRGFETVTYVVTGAMAHEDCEGHSGIINAGDVQWMTAGKGIMHSEFPATEGDNRGLQLWVNLARKHKMCEPKYQELTDAQIPKAEKEGVQVKVIAGESLGVHSPVLTLTPTMYLDVTLRPGAELHQPVPEEFNAFAYVLDGVVTFGSPTGLPSPDHSSVLFGKGNGVSVYNTGVEAARFVLIGGQPLNEPVAQAGPMVMNTREEVMEAMRDFQMGRNGFERAVGWTAQRRLRAR